MTMFLLYTTVYPKINTSRDTIQKDHIYHTKQYQTFYRKIKCDLLNFRGVTNGYKFTSGFSVSDGFYSFFFHKMANADVKFYTR